MLRIAVPNKGSLSEPASVMLREAGYRQRSDHRELVLTDAENDVEFFFLRPRDIAVYVGSGDLDLGITGRDLLLDSRADADEVLQLGFAGSTFRFAARPGTVEKIGDLAGRRIATSYSGLVERHLAEHGVSADVIRLDGAVETSIRLGLADVIADVVETGSTLRQQGLEIIGEPILRSEAVLIRAPRRRGEPAGRSAPAPAAGRAGGPPVRDARLRRARRAGGRGLRAHPGHRGADDLAAAPRGLGGRAGDGAAQGHQPDHGRAVRHRCAGDPRDRHQRLQAVRYPEMEHPVIDVRPRRLRKVCWGMALVVIVLFTLVATALRGDTEGGGAFAPGDQAAMIGLGLLLAGAVLLFTRPRVEADEQGVRVRNVIGGYELPWKLVRAVRFDNGSPWASLELLDDETIAVMAVQANDKEYAVDAIRGLRRLHAEQRDADTPAAE